VRIKAAHDTEQAMDFFAGHCEAQRDEAIQQRVCPLWIASA
jgi:hypothetical protein